jgi:tetratricopeptide (TPR) repeat protein
MRSRICALSFLLLLSWSAVASSRQSQPPSGSVPPKASAKKSSPAPQSDTKPKADDSGPSPNQPAIDPDTELQVLVREAGNDPDTLAKNLQAYLAKYPDTPRRAPIYRALLEAEMQRHDQKSALEYAEKIIELQPEDSQSMYVAITLLEKMPDQASQLRAVDYDSRLIERVGKADPESRPQQMTLDEWQAGRNKFMVDLYVLRGRIEHHLHKNDDAMKDLSTGYRLIPNADAALALGEIAEEEKRADDAVRQYAAAFMLSGEEQRDANEAPLDRDALRLRMGNLWRFTHDSNAGLGDILLSAYDTSHDLAKAEKLDAPTYNKGVADPLQFSMRRVNGSGAVKLAESRGKVVVMEFWTTWSVYSKQMELLLAGVRTKFAGRDDVIFLSVNADEEESLVAPFVKEETPGGVLVFADGINRAFHVESIPTFLILDKAGKIAYRMQGFAPDGLADLATAAITKASAAPAP